MDNFTGQSEEIGPELELAGEVHQTALQDPAATPVYESMVSTSKFMTTDMNAWDWVWRKDHGPSETPRFGSLFRLLPGLPEYRQKNLRPHYKTGVLSPSFAGWEQAIAGMIAIDIDRKDLGSDELNLQAALESARQIVLWLRQNGVRDE